MADATLFPPAIKSSAKLSECGRYRYWLTRIWNANRPIDCWCMLNPSTADAEKNDPTILRVMDFSRRLGAGGVIVVNAFAWRATMTTELRTVPDPIGPDNDAEIIRAAKGKRIIAAWGLRGTYLDRDKAVIHLLKDHPVFALHITKDGQPGHPLYLPQASILRPFDGGKK